MFKHKLVRYLLLAIGLLVLSIFISTLELESLKIALNKLNLFALLIIIVFVGLNILIKAFRWQFLIHKTSKKRIPIRFSLLSILAGVASGSITPGRGEIAKPLMLKKYNIPLSESIAAAFIEKIFDLFALCLLFVVSFIFFTGYSVAVYFIYLILAVFMLFLLFIIYLKKVQYLILNLLKKVPVITPKIIESGIKFFEGFAVLKKKRVLFLVSILSVFSMLLEVARIFYIFAFFGLGITFFLAMFSFSAAIVIGTISLVPGGIGINEVSQTAIIAGLISTETGMLKNSILLDRFFAYYLLVFLGVLILLFGAKINNKINQ